MNPLSKSSQDKEGKIKLVLPSEEEDLDLDDLDKNIPWLNPEILEKYDTTPKINANNLSKKAQDIFLESLGMSSTYKSPKVQTTSTKSISTKG